MTLQQQIDEAVKTLDDWLINYDKIYPIQGELSQSIQHLNIWLSQWKQIYAIVRKKSYTLADATALTAIFQCTVVKVKTKYNLVDSTNKVLFTGTLVEVVNYCFNNLIKI